MTYQPATIPDDLNTLPKLPNWVTGARPETPEDVAFLSGAALSHLHLVATRKDVPQTLLRDRLALQAAEACVAHSGRSERAGELRDAVQFLQPGDHPGPAGEVYLIWRRGVERPLSVKALRRALPHMDLDQIAEWLDQPAVTGGQGPVARAAPVTRAAAVLEAVLAGHPRAQTQALLLADAALAQSLGWSHLTPLLALGLKRADLRDTGDALSLACHRAIAKAAGEVMREASDLTRRAARLNAVAPKLRAKGSEKAVALFLSQDAVAPGELSSLRSDRSARRLCDRLVELGAVRELTGRDTFRLYGV